MVRFLQGTYRVIRSVLLTGAALLGLVSILVFGVSALMGIRPLNVISGSMEPTIPTGAMIFSRLVPASELAVGDIVTTNRVTVEGLVTHRVVSIEPVEGQGGQYAMVMRGDANSIDDADPYVIAEAHRYVFQIPVLGLVSTLIKTQFGISVLIAAAALLAFFVVIPGKRTEKPAKTPDPVKVAYVAKAPVVRDGPQWVAVATGGKTPEPSPGVFPKRRDLR